MDTKYDNDEMVEELDELNELIKIQIKGNKTVVINR